MKEKIEAELQKIRQLEEEQQEYIKQQQLKREKELRLKMRMHEEEEKRKKEVEEKLKIEQKKFEEQERKRMLKQMEEIKAIEAREEQRKKAKELELKKEAEAKRKKEMAERQEQIRQKAIEEEKKRLWEIEKEKERVELEKQRMERIESDRRIAAEILARRQAEEQETVRLKEEAEKERLLRAEELKKAALENKKKNILQVFQKQESLDDSQMPIEKPKKKKISNPFAQKFESIAKTAKQEEEEYNEMIAKKKKLLKKSKASLSRSKQLLSKLSQENIKRSQNLLKKISTESLKKSKVKGSKINISRQKVNHIESQDNKSVNKQQMQDYLISQVLFDGKEDVRSSKMSLDQKNKKAEEDKQKEIDLINREYELKKRIEAEMQEMRKKEEENKLKLKEAEFEAYKKEMEKYLSFVCEEKDVKEEKVSFLYLKKIIFIMLYLFQSVRRKSKAEEPKKKLTVNIGSIKNQFEKENVTETSVSPIKTQLPQVNKLASNIFDKKKNEDENQKKKKEYVPIIIDRDAFDRTKLAFEKQKKEEEERVAQLKIKQRQKEMEEQRLRILKEKEEQERLLQEQLRLQDIEEERRKQIQRKEIEKQKKLKEEEEAKKMEEERLKRQLEDYEKNREKNIFDQIKNELEKIKEEDEKMRVKIEKERKKKSLLQQIQNEIGRIKGTDNSNNDEDTIIDDETPPWLKLVINNKNKELKGETKVCKLDIKQELCNVETDQSQENASDSIDNTPSWIKIFQERSEKLRHMQIQNIENLKPISAQEIQVQEDENKKEEFLRPTLKQSISLNIDYDTAIADNESINPKSVKERKEKLQNQNANKVQEEKPVVKRTKTVVDRVRKVKSLLLDGGQKDERHTKEQDVKVAKGKAKKIKGLFENVNNTQDEEVKPLRPKKPKRKVIKNVVEHPTEDLKKKEERDWKWKHKSVSELYSYINYNKQHIPDSITKLTENTDLNLQTATATLETEEQQKEQDEEFETYLSSIHDYIEQKDKDDTESCFKNTIKAYLDLIEDPKKLASACQKNKPKNISLTSTSILKHKIEESFQKENSTIKKDVQVGKVDASFLMKGDETTESKKSDITKDIAKGLISKYENIKTTDQSTELYSMKRKLIPCKEDIDTNSWKKQQVEHQWKYKQKNIKDLQSFILQKNEKINVHETLPTMPSYTSMFKHIDYSARVVEEEKKMEEFEKFMDELHDYLENDTADENESAFKWGIHAYMDLIEDNDRKSEISVKYERKNTNPEKIPKLSETKAKLTSVNDPNQETIKEVGKLDVNAYLNALQEAEVKEELQTSNINLDVKGNVLDRRSIFDSQNYPSEIQKDKTFVKKKIIDVTIPDDQQPQNKIKNKHEWKYKKKNIQELQEFISKNKDLASRELLIANNKMDKKDTVTSSIVLANSARLVSEIKDKDEEFEKFMSELNDYMNEKSASTEQEEVKENIRQYVQLIEPRSRKNRTILPEIGSARKITDIKNELNSNNEKVEKQVNTNLIGKVSHFFKKNTNEKLNSKVVKENIASLLEPGNAKVIKANLEKKPKLQRSSSVIELPVSKLKTHSFFEQDGNDSENIPTLDSLKASRKSSKSYKFQEERYSIRTEAPCLETKLKKPKLEPIKSAWDHITDPEEKKKAIMAKYGLRMPNHEKRDADLEEILNYEHEEDMKEFEKELRQRYFLCDGDESSRESSPERNRKDKTGSHSSLLNILNVMKKAATGKNFSDAKAKVKDFGKSSHSKSDIDLSEIGKSCSDFRSYYESGDAFNKEVKRGSIFDDEEMSQFNTANKKTEWERSMKSSNSSKTRSIENLEGLESINKMKELFEKGEVSKEALHDFIDSRSCVKSSNNNEERHLSVEEELEELRNSSKIKNMFRLEKGKSDSGSSLRRTNSCIGVSGERLTNELDEEVMAEVSVTNKMVKAMFENSAPKYKFGGSGSNISLSSSKENLKKSGPVTRPSVKPKEERKWVLDTINKFFDVIVEEDEEEEYDDDEEDYESDEYEDDIEVIESDYSYEDESDSEIQETNVDNYQSTNKMRGLLSSVVNKISGSVGNLAQKDLIQNLKQNLGSQINIRSSVTNLSST